MPTIKELRENGGKAAAEIKRLADLVNPENRDFKPEERTAWEKANADYNSCLNQIEIAERADEVSKRMSAPAGDRDVGRDVRTGAGTDGAQQITEEHRNLCFSAWCRTQMDLDI